MDSCRLCRVGLIVAEILLRGCKVDERGHICRYKNKKTDFIYRRWVTEKKVCVELVCSLWKFNHLVQPSVIERCNPPQMTLNISSTGALTQQQTRDFISELRDMENLMTLPPKAIKEMIMKTLKADK